MADISIQFDPTHDLTLCKVVGEMKRGEVARSLGGEPMQRPSRLLLLDLQEATSSDRDADSMMERAMTYGSLFSAPDTKTALVYADDTGFGLGRMLEAYFEAFDIETELRSFQDMEQARAWLLE